MPVALHKLDPNGRPRTMATTLALFCRVIDNFGDIGICFRLARQLVAEHQIDVMLWVDDLHSFQRLCGAVSSTAAQQQIEGIRVIHWVAQTGPVDASEVADIVIEFFGCELPAGYINAMRLRQPVWLNLEGLSAEDWVEGCHTLPSPQAGQTKYFFYPGFTARTGGLLLEAGLLAQRDQFRRQPQTRIDFLARLGVTAAESAAIRVSLFCYPDAPIAQLFAAWQNNPQPITCLVPQGVATAAIEAWMGAAQSATRGALTVRVIPFLSQPDFDRLLWSCDLNFVRGEDSLVRAHWALQPLIWHIYPQDQALHHVKLRAFLARSGIEEHCPAQHALSLAWNGASGNTSDWPQLWLDFTREHHKISALARTWALGLSENGDLATNLCYFCESIAGKSGKPAL